MFADTSWRADISDLRTRARTVTDPAPAPPTRMRSRHVAMCLSGIVGLAARRFSLERAQRACADLARADRAWETRLGDLPRALNGVVPEEVVLISAAARGLYAVAQPSEIRDALAFWAAESDPAVWMSLSEAA